MEINSRSLRLLFIRIFYHIVIRQNFPGEAQHECVYLPQKGNPGPTKVTVTPISNLVTQCVFIGYRGYWETWMRGYLQAQAAVPPKSSPSTGDRSWKLRWRSCLHSSQAASQSRDLFSPAYLPCVPSLSRCFLFSILPGRGPLESSKRLLSFCVPPESYEPLLPPGGNV